VSGNARHGAVVSIDGDGVITLHFPYTPKASTALVASAEPVPLAHSYELDAAPGFERFILVTAAEPIDVTALLSRAERLGRSPGSGRSGLLQLSKDETQWSIVVRKEASP
jgi:hypothetical protein